MGWLITFMAWQIAVLPHIIAVSVGTGMIIIGFVFFSHVFWPELWEEDEHATG